MIRLRLLRLAVALGTHSTSSSAWTLDRPWTRAIPSLDRKCQSFRSRRVCYRRFCGASDASAVPMAAVVPQMAMRIDFGEAGRHLSQPAELHIPDGKDAASLSEARLLLDTANSLLENGGDLGRRGLGVGGVGSGLHGHGGGCGISDLGQKNKLAEAPTTEPDCGDSRRRSACARLQKCIQRRPGPVRRSNGALQAIF